MTASAYAPPVDSLLKIGDPREQSGPRDYVASGVGPEHVPDLIRVLQDEKLHHANSESPEVWGPLHAWRALGQLRAEAAIEPLLGLLHLVDDEDDDWVGEELPGIFGQIGAAAIAPLEQYAASAQSPMFARQAAADGLKEIGQQHPQAREAVVAALTRLLENYAQPGRDPGLNGFIILYLTELEAREAAPLMERAFAAGVVAEDIQGDWEDVQVELGLKERRTSQPKPKAASGLETIRLIEQLRRQQSRVAQAAKTAATAEVAGPKRKHHRRKK